MTRVRVKIVKLHGILFFVAVFLGCTSTGRVGLCFLWFLCPGTSELYGQTDLGFYCSNISHDVPALLK